MNQLVLKQGTNSSSLQLGSLYPFFAVFVLLSTFTKNPLESTYGALLLLLILTAFWKRNFVFIIPYCLIWHWLEIFTSVWEANYFGLTLNENFHHTGQQTLWLAGFGLLSIILGLKLALLNYSPPIPYERIRIAAQRINFKKLLTLYAVFFILEIFLSNIAFQYPQFTQLILHFSNLKLVLYILISYVFFIGKKSKLLYLTITLLEFISGLYSFFSDFKIVFIVIAFTYATSIQEISIKKVAGMSVLVSMAIVSLFYWQVIKGQYRQYVQQGSQGMVVNTTFTESINKIIELSSEVDANDFDPTIRAVFRRLGYLQFFSEAVGRVPSVIPYERGKLLAENLNFAFVPRIINPNKGVKDDRRKLEKYLGYTFWTVSSISLSYYAEAYIDFGPMGMMVFMVIFGFLVGKLFFACLRLGQSLNLLLVYSICFVVLVPFATYGADAISIFGKLVWGAVAHLIIFKLAYRRINRFITSR